VEVVLNTTVQPTLLHKMVVQVVAVLLLLFLINPLEVQEDLEIHHQQIQHKEMMVAQVDLMLMELTVVAEAVELEVWVETLIQELPQEQVE
jgi:hypothetical protein